LRLKVRYEEEIIKRGDNGKGEMINNEVRRSRRIRNGAEE
jgi:hypothetical protein